MSRYRMYNHLARRKDWQNSAVKEWMFRAKAHAWFTKRPIPWWLLLTLGCFLMPLAIAGCAADILGGAKSDCDRYTEAQQEAQMRCPFDTFKKAEHCPVAVYTPDGDKVEECIKFVRSASCEDIVKDTNCNHIEWIYL